jgi:hypothetical protein
MGAVSDGDTARERALRDIVAFYAGQPMVTAVAIAGSHVREVDDPGSDIDLYVYCDPQVPVAARGAFIAARSDRYEIDNHAFGDGDEWIERESGLRMDGMLWQPAWMEEQVARVVDRHEARTGYTTCFWYTVQRSTPLFDREGWFERLQAKARQPYPPELKRAIVALNQPVLRGNLSSLLSQIERAVAREDWLSVNHRTTALLECALDILFAINDQPHPGEKRLLAFIERDCPKRPKRFADLLEAILSASCARPPVHLVPAVQRFLDALDLLVAAEMGEGTPAPAGAP